MHIEDLNRSQNAEWQMNEMPSKCINSSSRNAAHALIPLH